MGDIVNLKRYKKRVAREAAASDANARRASFGRTRAERKQQQEQNRKHSTSLDQHRIDKDRT